jgi:hypothetical protein
MSDVPDPELDNCHCCEVEVPETEISNPPGQPQLRYRIDIQPTFLQRMVNDLPHQTVPPGSTEDDATRPLNALSARALDDPSIALLDAWATVADVLTFYQERIANEGYLRTAVERRSVLELARQIGYELSPGVAAFTELAFTVEDAPGAPRNVPVPLGTRVLSVPGPGETPQTFETIEEIVARPEWNAFPARRDDPGWGCRSRSGTRCCSWAAIGSKISPAPTGISVSSTRSSPIRPTPAPGSPGRVD